MPTPVIGAVGLGLQAVSFIGQRRQAKKANVAIEQRAAEQNLAIEAQNKAAEQRRQAEERRQALQRRRERFRLLSEARRQRASVVASAAQRTGVGGLRGSAVQGAQAVVQNRLASALGYQSALAASGRELSAASAAFAQAGGALDLATNIGATRLADIQTRSKLFSGIGSLGGSVINFAGSPAGQTTLSRLRTIFD